MSGEDSPASAREMIRQKASLLRWQQVVFATLAGLPEMQED